MKLYRHLDFSRESGQSAFKIVFKEKINIYKLQDVNLLNDTF